MLTIAAVIHFHDECCSTFAWRFSIGKAHGQGKLSFRFEDYCGVCPRARTAIPARTLLEMAGALPEELRAFGGRREHRVLRIDSCMVVAIAHWTIYNIYTLYL